MSMTTSPLDTPGVLNDTRPTGFGGVGQRVPRWSVIVVSGALSVSSTSSAEPAQIWEAPFFRAYSATAGDSGWSVHDEAESSPQATSRAVSELRRLSGLTWDQLAELFCVSRRSVHFWASGKPLNAANEHRLMRVLDVVREADRGDPRSTRAALLEATRGNNPFDLLVSQRFDEARARLGAGPGRSHPTPTELGAAARAARAPLPPGELVDARHESVHHEVGHGRAARTLRKARREGG